MKDESTCLSGISWGDDWSGISLVLLKVAKKHRYQVLSKLGHHNFSVLSGLHGPFFSRCHLCLCFLLPLTSEMQKGPSGAAIHIIYHDVLYEILEWSTKCWNMVSYGQAAHHSPWASRSCWLMADGESHSGKGNERTTCREAAHHHWEMSHRNSISLPRGNESKEHI